MPVRAATRSSGTKKPVQRSVVRVAELWEQKMGEKRTAPMIPYSIKATFKLGDVIQHPNFGVGIVEDVRKGGKISVLFRETEKTLVHGMGT